MTVYIVLEKYDGPYEMISRIFSTKELASDFCDYLNKYKKEGYPNNYYYEEWVVLNEQ